MPEFGSRDRYTVHPLGEGWAVHDAEQNNRVVHWFPHQALAETCCIFGCILGPCALCNRPGAVQILGAVYCVDCIPESETWGMIPLAGLRLWSKSHHR